MSISETLDEQRTSSFIYMYIPDVNNPPRKRNPFSLKRASRMAGTSANRVTLVYYHYHHLTINSGRL